MCLKGIEGFSQDELPIINTVNMTLINGIDQWRFSNSRTDGK